MLPQILPQLLDADMAKLVQEHLEEKGMKILTSKGVEEFLGEDKVTAIMAGGEKIEADLFISAFGVRANTNLPLTQAYLWAKRGQSKPTREWKPT